MKQTFQFRRTTMIMIGLIAFLSGLAMARLNIHVHGYWTLLAVLLVVTTAPKRRLVGILSVLLLGFLLGIWRGTNFLQLVVPYERLNEQRVTARVVAEGDAIYNDRQQLEFDGGNVKVLDPVSRDLPGRLKVSGFGEPAIYRGDVVQVEGKLFQTRGSRQATIGFGELKVLGRSGSILETARRNFVAGMITALPEPHASFGLGLLIGQRNTLPDSVTDSLSAVGLTHIIAVSGYNLTIIIRAIRRVGDKRSKYQITLLSFVLMGAFLLVTGFSASIVRAAIVSCLSLLAWYYGRNIRPVLLLLLAAVITSAWNPLYLWSDIGWYLSFLAFFGVLVLAPLLVHRLLKHEPKVIAGVMLESLCAQIMTMPLVLHIFSVTSLVALPSNMMIVPLVPLAMLFSLVAGIVGMFAPILAGLFALPARIILTYILDVVQLLSRVPHASISRSLSVVSMIIMYGAILLVALVMWRRVSKNGNITDKESIF